jgi:tripartite-type tricarboxylate transporter receptor subunit TctC
MKGMARFALLVLLAALAGLARAQDYPAKPVTIVVPFAAGGAVDGMSRLLASHLTEVAGETFIVENRAGASGFVGMGSVARSQPDGYTVLYSPNSIAIAPALYRKLSFNPEKDLVPVTQFASTTLVLTAHPKTKLATVHDLVSLAKAQPGKLNFGSSGVADPLQLGMEMLKTSAGLDMVAIPYKGQGPMFAALLGGEVDVAFASLQLALGPIKAGTLKVLATGGARRSAALPGAPTVAESGFPGFEISSWHGIFAPAGTPQAVIERLHELVAKAAQNAEVRRRVEATGNEVIASSPSEFEAKFKSDVAKFKRVVHDARIPFQD